MAEAAETQDTEPSDTLAGVGLTLSDAVCILLTLKLGKQFGRTPELSHVPVQKSGTTSAHEGLPPYPPSVGAYSTRRYLSPKRPHDSQDPDQAPLLAPGVTT